MVRSLGWVLAHVTVMMCLGPGCQKVVVIRAVEPAIKEISGIQRLAMLDLAYEQVPSAGRDLANAIVAELNQTGAFEVMERSAVARVLKEREFTASGAVDATQVSAIGKLLGVDGVVVGEVVVYDAGSKALGKYATVGANLRLVDVNSAQVVFSDSITSKFDKFMADERKEVTLTELAQELAKTFVSRIAPHYVDRKKYLLAAGGDTEKANARGIKFAENGLWDKAQEQFELGLRADPDNAAVHNNLGVCHERAGRLTQAVEAYEAAIGLDPDQDYIQKNLASLRTTFQEPVRSAKQVLESQNREPRIPATTPP